MELKEKHFREDYFYDGDTNNNDYKKIETEEYTCPVCGGWLEWTSTLEHNDMDAKMDWKCSECGSIGECEYVLTFQGHCVNIDNGENYWKQKDREEKLNLLI